MCPILEPFWNISQGVCAVVTFMMFAIDSIGSFMGFVGVLWVGLRFVSFWFVVICMMITIDFFVPFFIDSSIFVCFY